MKKIKNGFALVHDCGLILDHTFSENEEDAQKKANIFFQSTKLPKKEQALWIIRNCNATYSYHIEQIKLSL